MRLPILVERHEILGAVSPVHPRRQTGIDLVRPHCVAIPSVLTQAHHPVLDLPELEHRASQDIERRHSDTLTFRNHLMVVGVEPRSELFEEMVRPVVRAVVLPPGEVHVAVTSTDTIPLISRFSRLFGRKPSCPHRGLCEEDRSPTIKPAVASIGPPQLDPGHLLDVLPERVRGLHLALGGPGLDHDGVDGLGTNEQPPSGLLPLEAGENAERVQECDRWKASRRHGRCLHRSELLTQGPQRDTEHSPSPRSPRFCVRPMCAPKLLGGARSSSSRPA